MREEFGIHDYFKTLSVAQSRLRFRIFARMTHRVAMCFKSDPKYIMTEHQCIACRAAGEEVSETKDTEEHIVTCKYYLELREDLDLETDPGIVTYFQRVISRRARTDKFTEEDIK